MKSRLILLAGLFLIMLSDVADAQLKVAPEIGFNLSSVIGNGDATDNTVRFTGKFGGILQVPLDSAHFYLQPGLFYSMQGQSQYDNVIASNYIQLPVNIIYKIGKKQDRFFVGAGLYWAYAVSDRVRSGTISGERLPIGNSKQDALKPFDLGANVRVGHELANGLFLAAQYSLGFVNTYPGNESYNVKNWVISITAGYYIPLRKEKEPAIIK